jgi:ubiquinone biosynthesis accessory factor UbiK
MRRSWACRKIPASVAESAYGVIAALEPHCRHNQGIFMIELKSIDDLARRLHELVPPGMRDASGDLQKHFRATLQTGLGKLDLVTREEFDVQRAVLLRTREKLELLERMVELLETRLEAFIGPIH